MKKKILVLFPNDWDRDQWSQSKYKEDFEFIFYGKEFFSFPYIFQLLHFDVWKFIKKLTNEFKNKGISAVLSSDEYIGAIIAAIVAEEIGLPGANPKNIILAQHKYYSRKVQQEFNREETPAFSLLSLNDIKSQTITLPYPFFVKPVKGTFSLFAKRVQSQNELLKHLNLAWYERLFFHKIMKPFNDLMQIDDSLEYDANHFIAEELIEGQQVTVDGFAFQSQVSIMGIVDSIMFPNTNIFERFDYPSRLDSHTQDRMKTLVKDTIENMGFDNGQFNVELFYDKKSKHIRIIEINPRLSYQFADLYENVDSSNTYDILLDLSLGYQPIFKSGAGRFQYSTSFVHRTFEGKKLSSIPTQNQVKSFSERYTESKIQIYGKKGTRMSSEIRAIGSYRYAIINIGALSLLDLFAIAEDAKDTLPFNFK